MPIMHGYGSRAMPRMIRIRQTLRTGSLAPASIRTFGRARPGHLRGHPHPHTPAQHWVAGLAALLALANPARAAWPEAAFADGAGPDVAGDGSAGEFAAQAIAPMAQGAGSGRHYAATNLVTRLDSAPERPSIDLTAVLGQNDDLARMLQRVGLASPDAAGVAALVAQAVPLAQIAPGTHVAIRLGARGAPGEPRPLDTLSLRARYDLDLTVARRGGALVLERHAIAIDTTPLHLTGVVGGSLYRAARAAGAAPDTVQAWLQAIDQYLPIEAIAPTDRFELVVAHKHAAGDSGGQDGDLLYAGIVRDGRPLLQVMRWGNDGNYYTLDALEGDGADSGGGLLAAPVAGNITSWFGLRRHPILGYVRLHAGIDFAAAWGSPVYAVSDGVVTYAGWHGGHGNYVRLDHGGGIDTGYGHMSRIAVGPGSHVTRGQVIGYVGSTGLSTGPHLHYELFRGGQPVDPMSVRFVPHHDAFGPADVAAFRAKMRQLLATPGALAQSRGATLAQI